MIRSAVQLPPLLDGSSSSVRASVSSFFGSCVDVARVDARLGFSGVPGPVLQQALRPCVVLSPGCVTAGNVHPVSFATTCPALTHVNSCSGYSPRLHIARLPMMSEIRADPSRFKYFPAIMARSVCVFITFCRRRRECVCVLCIHDSLCVSVHNFRGKHTDADPEIQDVHSSTVRQSVRTAHWMEMETLHLRTFTSYIIYCGLVLFALNIIVTFFRFFVVTVVSLSQFKVAAKVFA